MENKINIAELLKDCPQGMELDCTLLEGLEFDDIIDNEYLPIRCRVKNPDGGYNVYNFTKYGCWLNTTFAKCIIFPKDKTTWEGFQRPFKDGDILTYTSNHTTTFIYRNKDNEPNFSTSFYVACNNAPFNNFLIYNKYALIALNGNCDVRLATEEEKQKLFDAIKANGYKWNEETKTLEKLIGSNFHEGDWIACEELNTAKILSINMDRYEVEFIDGNKGFPHIDYIDRNFHLWTIQDAKDGDILAFNDETIVIFKDLYNKTSFHSYCHIEEGIFTISKKDMPDWWEGKGFYPATEEQRTFLFRKIKEAGYKWNAETKTLEKLIKPIFKVGDKIRYKRGNRVKRRIVKINNREEFYYTDDGGRVYFMHQDDWELVPNKFDITTLKVFDKVLVRDSNESMWSASIFSHTWKNKYICIGIWYNQCIPYEENKHLLGTTNDCDEFYKTWE